ncbi:GDSL-type esterase/lipase family protein [Streptomyces sp. NPDC048643]|uniref:GDSL-type esterase/lipase family protein n=1 Tax=Streptomyces sp. NPDC048643 TaxID=3155637 RepID=UPI003424F08F
MGRWQTGWMQAVADFRDLDRAGADETLRVHVVSAVAGERARVKLSNRFGSGPLNVGALSVSGGGQAVSARFTGRTDVTVPAGQECWSDPLDVAVQRGGKVTVDLYLPTVSAHATGNYSRMFMEVSEAGDHVGSSDFPAVELPTIEAPDGSRLPLPVPFVCGLEVFGPEVPVTAVCLGDSITAGGWPEGAQELLAPRLDVVMLNAGIAGNRLRTDPAASIASFGPSGVSRFERDVLSVAGTSDVVIALGTNDLGLPGAAAPLADLPSAQQMIDSYRRLSARAVEAGLDVTIATITPFLGSEGYDDSREEIRSVVNDWIRTAAPHHVDFDAVLRDAQNPRRLAEAYDSGDHLHPNTAGTARLAHAMAAHLARRHGFAVD